jgi:hypothetical protein
VVRNTRAVPLRVRIVDGSDREFLVSRRQPIG